MRESFKKAVDYLGQDEGVPERMHGAFHDMAGRAATHHEMGGRTIVASAKSRFMGPNGTELKHTIVSTKAGTEPQIEEHHLYRNNVGNFVLARGNGVSSVGAKGQEPKGLNESDMTERLYRSHTLD